MLLLLCPCSVQLSTQADKMSMSQTANEMIRVCFPTCVIVQSRRMLQLKDENKRLSTLLREEMVKIEVLVSGSRVKVEG